MHHSVLYPKLSHMFIIQQILVRLGACLTSPNWADECSLLDYCKHMPLYNCSSPDLHEFNGWTKFSFEAGSVVLFPAWCRLTPCYPLQSDKDVVVLVRCSQQLIREELRFERTSTAAIGGLKKKEEEINRVCFQQTCKQYVLQRTSTNIKQRKWCEWKPMR